MQARQPQLAHNVTANELAIEAILHNNLALLASLVDKIQRLDEDACLIDVLIHAPNSLLRNIYGGKYVGQLLKARLDRMTGFLGLRQSEVLCSMDGKERSRVKECN